MLLFLSGCETTSDETLFFVRPFFCAMKAFVVSFALLCHDARERERDRQRDRETHLHSSVMMRFVSSQNARGVKNIIIEREDDEKKMIERNDGHFPDGI